MSAERATDEWPGQRRMSVQDSDERETRGFLTGEYLVGDVTRLEGNRSSRARVRVVGSGEGRVPGTTRP